MKKRLGVLGPEVDSGDETVALIGAAPSVYDFPFDAGAEYDYVVRVNYALPLTEKMIEATGPACDVLYTIEDPLSGIPATVRNRVPLIRLHPDVSCNHCRCLEVGNLVSYVDEHFFQEVCRKVSGGGSRDFRPNMGLLAMADLVESGWKVYATGFSFFQPVNNEVYAPDYPNPDRAIMEETRGDYRSHRQRGQIEYFRKELAPRLLGMDPVMEFIWKEQA